MHKPTSKSRLASTPKGREESVQKGKSTVANNQQTPKREPAVRRKTSAEITNKVNGFIEEARANARNTSSVKKPEIAKTKLPVTKREASPMTEFQHLRGLVKAGLMPPSMQGKVMGASQKANSSTATISLGKSQASKPRTDQSSYTDLSSMSVPKGMTTTRKAPVEGRSIPKSVAVSIPSTGPADGKGRIPSGKTRISSGKERIPSGKASAHKNIGSEGGASIQSRGKGSQRQPSTKMLNSYMSSSSSEDEGYEQPPSPGSKAKMWNEIHNSLGPSFPGWKFRPPAQGQRMTKLGPEELSRAFETLGLKTNSESQTPDNRPNKFSDYMKKIKSDTKEMGTDASTSAMERNAQLKRVYSQQLDAMREKASDSLKTLGVETTGSTVPESELEVLREGINRKHQEYRMSSTDMLKNAVENLKQLKKDNPAKTLPTSSLRENAGHRFEGVTDNLAQGDSPSGRSETERGHQHVMPSNFGDTSRPQRDDRSSREKNVWEDSGEESEEIRIGALRDNPLRKLKTMSEKIGMDRTEALRRRASQVLKFSSSESDFSEDDKNMSALRRKKY